MKAFLVLLLLLTGFSSQADVVLPLDSLRSQGNSDHCWAYATSHVILSRLQWRDGITASLNMERDLMYWVYYDRFMQRYKTGKQLDVNKDAELLDAGGFPAEFWSKFLEHGHHIYSTQNSAPLNSISYPDIPTTINAFIPAKKVKGVDIKAEELLKKLKKIKNNSYKASSLILDELDKSSYALTSTSQHTKWFNHSINLTDSPEYILGDDYDQLSQDELLWIFETKKPKELHKFETYYNGKYKNYYMEASELESLTKESLNKGFSFVITLHGADYVDHVMTGIGYSNDKLLVADSLPSHYYWVNFSELESIMIFRSLTSGLTARMGPMSLPPTQNPRIRKFKTPASF